MALTVLGLSGAVSHDPSAALYIDGKLVAAVEEERFVRDKHAKNRMPYESAKFCLEQAGIEPADVDVVAIPFAPISIMEKARWHYAKRYAYAPDRALDAILLGNRRYKRYYKRIEWCLQQLGFDLKKIKIQPVEHHLAHASSAYHCWGSRKRPRSSASTARANTPPLSSAGRERSDPQDQGVLRSGFAGRPVRRDHRVPRLRHARRRVQGHGHGALR